MVTPTETGTWGLGLTIIDLVGYFYNKNGLVDPTQMERLQRSFDVLTNLFDQVVLWKNTWKTVSMVLQPLHAPGRM